MGARSPPVFGSASLDWGLAEWHPGGCYGAGGREGVPNRTGRTSRTGWTSRTPLSPEYVDYALRATGVAVLLKGEVGHGDEVGAGVVAREVGAEVLSAVVGDDRVVGKSFVVDHEWHFYPSAVKGF